MSGKSEVEIVETDKIQLREPLVIFGFVGAGLVGQIAVNHISDKMREIAHVRSMHIPPSVVFIDGELRHPFRIYSDNEGELCTIVCDAPISSESIYPVALGLFDWVEERRARELVVLEGFPLREIPKQRHAFCAAEPEKRRECEEKGVKMLEGRVVIHGIAGAILNECLTRRITGLALMTPASAFIPDPEGAATLVKALNKIYDLKINTKGLLNQASTIKRAMKEVAQSYQEMTKREEKGAHKRLYV